LAASLTAARPAARREVQTPPVGPPPIEKNMEMPAKEGRRMVRFNPADTPRSILPVLKPD
jgi:hypothetical protein